MKIITPGREQRGWANEYICTGKGNQGGGCGAKLLVEIFDLYQTNSKDISGSFDYFVTFECAQCKVETDITDSPARGEDLPTKHDWKLKGRS